MNSASQRSEPNGCSKRSMHATNAWVRDCRYGIFRLATWHCATCTSTKVPLPLHDSHHTPTRSSPWEPCILAYKTLQSTPAPSGSSIALPYHRRTRTTHCCQRECGDDSATSALSISIHAKAHREQIQHPQSAENGRGAVEMPLIHAPTSDYYGVALETVKHRAGCVCMMYARVM